MKSLRFMWLRCTVAAGLKYQGSLLSYDRLYHVYSRYPLLQTLDEGMTFEGGMKAYRQGGVRCSGRGRVVMLWTDSTGKVHFFAGESIQH